MATGIWAPNPSGGNQSPCQSEKHGPLEEVTHTRKYHGDKSS